MNQSLIIDEIEIIVFIMSTKFSSIVSDLILTGTNNRNENDLSSY